MNYDWLERMMVQRYLAEESKKPRLTIVSKETKITQGDATMEKTSNGMKLQQAKNLFDAANRAASGICALGDVLRHTEAEHLNDCTVNHLGNLLELVGESLLETTYNGARHCEPQPAG